MIIPVSFSAKPVTINSPNPPAPMKAASVAVPIFITAAVLIPANMVGMANGISTYLKRCQGVRPIPVATFFNRGSIENNEVAVLRKIGNKAYRNSAAMAGIIPIPKNGIMKAKSAMEGMVCSNPVRYRIGFANNECL